MEGMTRMKKVACVVFEVDENEKVEDIVARIQNACSKVNICDIHQSEEKDALWRVRLSTILKNLGEDISTMGYSILFDIMECVEKEPEYQKYFLLKQLYGYVTEKTGTPYDRIARNIRTMIDRIYANNSAQYIQKVLGIDEESYKQLTNSSFIALLIGKLF